MAKNRTFHTIIVSDADPLFVALVAQQLLRAGMMVMADLHSEILDLARRVEPSLVILGDGRIDSRDLLSRLKKDPLTKAIPIVVASTITDESTRDLCLQLGAVDYCSRSVNSQLIEKVLTHLAFSKTRE